MAPRAKRSAPAVQSAQRLVKSPRTSGLRQFWAACGQTDGCTGCRHPAGQHHSAVCRERRAAWEDESALKKRTAEGPEEEKAKERQMVEPNAGEPSTKAKVEQDEEMAMAEPVARADDEQMGDMERQQDRKRAREDDQ
eukprot:14963226-Heterocapsa_arctica.AAC.1